MIGKKAPHFICDAIVSGQIKKISVDDFNNQYKVIFFYPLDFTFVCPTELHAFQDRVTDFEKRSTQIIGASVDSVYSHMAWLRTPKKNGGIEGISYPLISDINKTMTRDFGVLDEKNGVAMRGVFLLDKNNVIQSATINNLGLGRNIDEIIRLIDALQHVEQHGNVCPANWTQGKKSMKPTQIGLTEFFAD